MNVITNFFSHVSHTLRIISTTVLAVQHTLCRFSHAFSSAVRQTVLSYVLFLCKCVVYYCHRVSTQLQLTYISISITLYAASPILLLLPISYNHVALPTPLTALVIGPIAWSLCISVKPLSPRPILAQRSLHHRSCSLVTKLPNSCTFQKNAVDI